MDTPHPGTFDLIERIKQLLDPTYEVQAREARPLEPPPLPSHGSQLLARARVHVAKYRTQKECDKVIKKEGRAGERHSGLYEYSQPIPVKAILDDPEFKNFRCTIDPVKLTELQNSIDLEGLKIPIIVVAAPFEGYYYVRAGFRRVTAVRNLGWETITAIVLPSDTPQAEEYWINLIENTAREKLTPYELAEAAKLMRDQFKVSPSDFARKVGERPETINQLLLCMDRLPVAIVDEWRAGKKVPVEILAKLATLTTTEAIRNYRLWMGQRRLDISESLKRLQRKPDRSGRLWTVRGLERTQRLHMAIKISKMPASTKELCLALVEYMQGARKHVPGVIGDRAPKSEQPEETPPQLFETEAPDNRTNLPNQTNTSPTLPDRPNRIDDRSTP